MSPAGLPIDCSQAAPLTRCSCQLARRSVLWGAGCAVAALSASSRLISAASQVRSAPRCGGGAWCRDLVGKRVDIINSTVNIAARLEKLYDFIGTCAPHPTLPWVWSAGCPLQVTSRLCRV